MMRLGWKTTVWMGSLLCVLVAACGGGGGGSTPPPTIYQLTVESLTPSSGVSIAVSPNDSNNAGTGVTSFTRSYNAGTSVTLTAPATAGGGRFTAWSGGCAGAAGVTCTILMDANFTVTAKYNQSPITSVTVTPNPATATIGTQMQFQATVAGNGSYSSAVTWSVAGPAGSALSAGDITGGGLYTTPYPAPATVTVIATSQQDTTVSGKAVVTLNPPATTAGPALTVDAGNQTHPISPYIYGMNAYLLGNTWNDSDNAAAVAPTNITIDRWGGDSTERYNYQLDVTNDIDDWFFENTTGTGGDGLLPVTGVKAFDALVESNNAAGIKTLGTMPVIGWVSKDSTSCSYPQSVYPDQLAVNGKPAFSGGTPDCGSGIYPEGVAGCTNSSGCNIPADPTVTSIAAPPPTPPAASAVNTAWAEATWAGSWTNYIVNKFGPGNPPGGTGKGAAIWDLDNEPSWWFSNDADVHPLPFTYDEVTNGGIGTALAIKTVDPTAEVSGPVMDWWWAYFYSMKDITSGWGTGPCYEPWSHPIDREAHGGVPFIEYYLQQFKAAETTYGKRLLDYVDLHTYFAASYNGAGLGLNPAGDTGAQQARINSTRAFWDPTYTDPNYPQPNYITDANYTANCSTPLQAPQLIRMMKTWVANDYPGTKTAIDEYNFGGLEAINGALTQADILGIFGREGLDNGMFWPTTNPSQQIPGMMAFQVYRNYDGSKSTFGDMALESTSADQGTLSIYGALRTADNVVTVVVINKTYGDLAETLSLANLTPNGTAKVYLYSNANLAGIVAQPDLNVTPPSGGGTTSTLSTTFPAQSITVLVVPKL
jgi:hypothetical protein